MTTKMKLKNDENFFLLMLDRSNKENSKESP